MDEYDNTKRTMIIYLTFTQDYFFFFGGGLQTLKFINNMIRFFRD